jgi:hypothetical protein
MAMWRKTSLQLDYNSLKVKTTNKKKKEKKKKKERTNEKRYYCKAYLLQHPHLADDVSPRVEELPDIDDDGGSEVYPVSVYGMTVQGLVKDKQVWFAVSSLLFAQLKISQSEQELFSTWPKSLAVETSDVPGHTFLLTRAGLLRLIAFGSSLKALDILSKISEGLLQFDAATKSVVLGEQDRRTNMLDSRRKHKEKVQAELREWSASKLLKAKHRQQRRVTSAPSTSIPEEQQQPQQQEEKKTEDALIHVAKPQSLFRKMIREGSDKRLKEIVTQRQVLESLKTSRRKASCTKRKKRDVCVIFTYFKQMNPLLLFPTSPWKTMPRLWRTNRRRTFRATDRAL